MFLLAALLFFTSIAIVAFSGNVIYLLSANFMWIFLFGAAVRFKNQKNDPVDNQDLIKEIIIQAFILIIGFGLVFLLTNAQIITKDSSIGYTIILLSLSIFLVVDTYFYFKNRN